MKSMKNVYESNEVHKLMGFSKFDVEGICDSFRM